MSNTEAKRKVMGRVELPIDRSTPSPRVGATVNGVRKGGHVRAKVDMSSFSISSPQSQPSPFANDATPQGQQYFNRPKRPNDNSLNNSPFLSPGSLSTSSASPSPSIRGNVASTSAIASPPQPPKVLRSASPIRQLQRNPPSNQDITSPYLAGPAKVVKERASGHARVNSSQITIIGGADPPNGRRHARVQSVSPFFNGSAAFEPQSRSPSPSEARSVAADRRLSLSSTASSALSAGSRQPATIPVRAQRAGTNARPPLQTAFSSYNSTSYSPNDAASPSLPSPSIAATMAKLPPYRDPGTGESTLQTPLQSPTSELAPQAQDAKKNRKILDLEITNKSLLAINSGLEVVKLQQAREIRELKRRLREGRTLDTSVSLDDGDDEEDEGVEEDSQTMEEEGTMDLELEMAHTRCKNMIDAMVNQARESILYKYELDPKHKGTSRVLHPVEVEMMQSQDAIRGEAQSVSPLPNSAADEAV